MMVLVLRDILSPAALSDLRTALAEADPKTDSWTGASGGTGEALLDGLGAHPLFRMHVQPKAITDFVIRTQPDAGPPRGAPPDARVRADVAVTVFLSEPDTYAGGGLRLDTGYGEEGYREAAGVGIVYPASARVRRDAVTRGRCWSAEILIESLIRDEMQREILYTISCAEQYLEVFAGGAGPDAEALRRCRERLSRLWCAR